MRQLVEELKELLEYKKHVAGPKRVSKYYEPCMKRRNDKEYCARVSWSIYCSNVNPEHKGCTKFGKKWGRPYSAPVAKKK